MPDRLRAIICFCCTRVGKQVEMEETKKMWRAFGKYELIRLIRRFSRNTTKQTPLLYTYNMYKWIQWKSYLKMKKKNSRSINHLNLCYCELLITLFIFVIFEDNTAIMLSHISGHAGHAYILTLNFNSLFVQLIRFIFSITFTYVRTCTMQKMTNNERNAIQVGASINCKNTFGSL